MAIGKKTIDLGLTSYDKLFMEEQEAEQRENIQQIPLEELHPFKNHPFRVLDDEKMAETVDSVREFGVLVPAIARPRPEGGYELIAGHRRHRASVLAGKETMPVIIRDMDDLSLIHISVVAFLHQPEGRAGKPAPDNRILLDDGEGGFFLIEQFQSCVLAR